MRRIEELLNKEMYFMDLDNAMVENGFYSVLDDGIVEDIKRDRNVVYTGVETGECEIKIGFEITIDSGEEEGPESFHLRVTNIDADRERISRRKEENMKNSFKYLMSKAVEFIDKLDYNEKIEDIHFSVRPYAHEGYSNHTIIVFFKDDENGNERDSQMYLFNLSKQEWELYR